MWAYPVVLFFALYACRLVLLRVAGSARRIGRGSLFRIVTSGLSSGFVGSAGRIDRVVAFWNRWHLVD